MPSPVTQVHLGPVSPHSCLVSMVASERYSGDACGRAALSRAQLPPKALYPKLYSFLLVV